MTIASTTAGGPFRGSRSNPFATRFIRPGVVAPLDASGQRCALEPLVDCLLPGTCQAVEGLHGRGKTNLVRSVIAAAAARGHDAMFQQVRSARDAWAAVRALACARPRSIVAIDGWERLPRPLAWLIPRLARWKRVAVLTTCHGPCGLPVLARCESSIDQLHAIVALLPEARDLIGASDVEAAFHRHEGNVRDALGELYDRFEERAARRAGEGMCGSCDLQRS